MNEIYDKFTKNARLVLTEAQKLAEAENLPISTEIILLSMIEISGTLSHDILREYSVTYDQIKLVLALEAKNRTKRTPDKITKHAREVLKEAFRIASDFGHFNIDTEHITIALLSKPEYGSFEAILRVGIEPEQIRGQLINIFNDLAEMDEMIKRQARQGSFIPTDPIVENEPHDSPNEFFEPPLPGRAFSQSQKTLPKKDKALEYFGCNLVEKAKAGEIDPVIGRINEINRATQILLRKNKNNPVFVGDPGVGKTAIVEGLALKIAQGKVPSKLINKRIFQLDLGLMVAGTMYRGQFEDRLKKVLEEVRKDKNIIVFIDELHSIVGTGSAEGSMDAANLLKPSLARGDIRLIGATTYEEYRKYIEKDPALERRLQPVKVQEPSVEETVEILRGVKKIYEKHHLVKITDEAILAAANLSNKFINDRFLPDKAIDLIDEASASKILTESNKNNKNEATVLREKIDKLSAKKELLIHEEKFEQAAKARDEELKVRLEIEKSGSGEIGLVSSIVIGHEDIARLVSQVTGVPLGEIMQTEAKRFLNIEGELQKHIAGQKEAIHEIANALRRNRSGISIGSKPIGSFIFLGPSGVGKTEVTRILAKYIYGQESALIKIDMSEFMERHNLARLTGAPPGYVGYDEAGRLTESVRKNPYSIVLFDEIEKAHPDVFNILLQILEDGRLTDSKGRVVDFKNTIVIMTSNIGIQEYRNLKQVGFNLGAKTESQDFKKIISEKLRDLFRPELINRIDKIIIFDPLKTDELIKIARLLLEDLTNRLEKKGFEIKFSSKVISFLMDTNYDKTFGARPLKRRIEETIENFLSDAILSGKVKKNQKIIIEINNESLVIK